MAEVEILKMNRGHDAVLDFFLANPTATLAEAAIELRYTISWLSVICNSNAYKAEYNRRRGGVEEQIQTDIVAHLKGLARSTIHRVEELVSKTDSLENATVTMDSVLGALGYSPSNPIVNIDQSQHNNVLVGSVPQGAFAQAQQIFGRKNESPALLEIQANALPAPDLRPGVSAEECGENSQASVSKEKAA